MESPTDNNDPNHHDDDYSEIDRQNRIVLIFVTLLILFSIWLVDGFRKDARMRDCVEAGHRNCMPLDVEQSK